ncbi:thioredoxin-like protein [Trametes versicolor FP-101664 SS1]|nr:thioredoxin-like protein [Trametes versicolor FP-101664 SS1]EIW63162.1 thioredoxin-like protein [Trametes versicolor FP-101664 SS1]
MPCTEQITLYTTTFSPYGHRAHIALEEAGAEYTLCQINVHRDKPEWYKRVNPLGKVPAITFGGPQVPPDEPSPESEKLVESLALLEFVADVFPEAKLLPASPVQRARARAFIAIYQNYLHDQFRDAFFRGEPVGPFLQALETLQSALPPAGFAVGEWSLAEAAVAPFLARMMLYLDAGLGKYSEADGETMRAALASERFARISQYVRDIRARASFVKSWGGDDVQLEAAKAIPMLRRPA